MKKIKHKKSKFVEQIEDAGSLRLDLGTGNGRNKPAGFIGMDSIKGGQVEQVVDLREPWPWEDDSVDELHANYLLPFFTPDERRHIVHEAYRVLKWGSKAILITPHWSSCKAYGDPATYWPPISEAWYARLNKVWREAQSYEDPNGYTCDFDHVCGYNLHPGIAVKNLEYQQHAVAFFKEATQDLIAHLIKVKRS